MRIESLSPEVVGLIIGLLLSTLGAFSTVLWWLFRRVMHEIDGLKRADERLAVRLDELAPHVIDRAEFAQHVEREEQALRDIREDMRSGLESLRGDLKNIGAGHQRLLVALAARIGIDAGLGGNGGE